MAIIERNKDWYYTIFSAADQYYMNVTVGGFAQYDLTLRLSADDVGFLRDDPNRAIALAKDVATRTDAYRDRLITPALDPS